MSDPSKVRCPDCGAEPGAHCVTPWAATRKKGWGESHVMRVEAARVHPYEVADAAERRRLAEAVTIHELQVESLALLIEAGSVEHDGPMCSIRKRRGAMAVAFFDLLLREGMILRASGKSRSYRPTQKAIDVLALPKHQAALAARRAFKASLKAS
jgi:hypothetical protein